MAMPEGREEECVVRRVSIDGLMGLNGIVGGELTQWQLENMAPFLEPPHVVANKRERVPRAVARQRAVKVAVQREKAHEKKERKRAERKEKRNPSLTVTAVFKRDPGPRSLTEFIIHLRKEQQPVLDIETTLQRMQMGHPRQHPPLQQPLQSGATGVSKTARRRVNTAVNEMSGLFTICCQVSPEAPHADSLMANE